MASSAARAAMGLAFRIKWRPIGELGSAILTTGRAARAVAVVIVRIAAVTTYCTCWTLCLALVWIGLPLWLSGKESACQCRRHWFHLWLGRSPGERNGSLSSVLAWEIPWTEEPGGHSPWGHKESDTTEWLNNNNWIISFNSLNSSRMWVLAFFSNKDQSSCPQLQAFKWQTLNWTQGLANCKTHPLNCFIWLPLKKVSFGVKEK